MKQRVAYETYAKIRDEKGLTDYAVAKQAELNNSQFSNWKAGRYAPKIDKLIRIAKALGVSVEELVIED